MIKKKERNPVMISQSIPPFIKEGGKWNCLDMDDDYVELVKKRLDSFTKRMITCEICCGSGIKGVANRWDHSYFNGKNNSNGTTEDVNRFYDDRRTKEVFGSYLEKMVVMFKSPYVKFSLINEPSTSAGRIYTWSWEMIRTYMREHIPNDQIMVEKFDSSRTIDFLKEGIWMGAHTVNSEKTVQRWLKSEERKWMVEYPTFYLCGDGLQRILDHGENGFKESELNKLSTELDRPQLLVKDGDGNYLNEWGELRECRAGFVNNLPE